MTCFAKELLAGILCAGILAPSAALAGAAADTGEQSGTFFEPAGAFFLRQSLTTGTVDITAFLTTNAGNIAVSGDWDGDGVDGIGIYNTTTGAWFLVDDAVDSPGAPLAADYSFFLATNGGDWLPITGDWDGIGGEGVGIYNKTTGTMFLVNNATETGGVGVPADLSLFLHPTGGDWLPITGAWNGGTADGVGIYNKTTGSMFLVNDATGGDSAAAAADYSLFLDPNGPAWLPVAGDWNDSGVDGVGIFSTTTGAFFLVNDAQQGPGAASPADLGFFIQGDVSPLGGADFLPVMGYWGTPP